METIIIVIQEKQYDAGYSSKILGAFKTEELADTYIQNQKRLDCIQNPNAYRITEYHKKLIPFNQ